MDIRKFFAKKPRLDAGAEGSNYGNSGNTEKESSSSIDVENESAEIKKTFSDTSQRPDDLSLIGDPIQQLVLKNFPKQKNNRSFHAEWYTKFKWLEYSTKLDSAFCYACRQFQPNANKERTYTSIGYKNWKNAMDPKNGFPKHEKTDVHVFSMSMWHEKLQRQSTDTSVSTMINKNILEKNRYYIKSIAEVVQFLAINELALRGTYEVEENRERGLFVNLFQYTIKKDPTLSECMQHIPKNAVYTSPKIQNEVIEILAEMVRENIVADIKSSDVPWFTLLEDGTRDKNNRENVSIGIRYVKEGKVFECLLGIYTTKKLDAKTFSELTLDTLKQNNIDTSRLLSQCYDGASVMTGKKGGVAALIQKSLNRIVPYVHCYNHRLHLVVVKMVSEIPVVKQFFDQCILLHSFFQHGTIAAIYEGNTIVRVLEQRWSGHLAIVNVIINNYEEILKTLDAIIKDNKFSGQDVAKSLGIKTVMLGLEFRVILIIMKIILRLLQPADSVLQARSSSLKDAVDIILSVKIQISNIRNPNEFQLIMEQAKKLVKNQNGDNISASKRNRQGPSTLNDYVILEKLPSYNFTQDKEEKSQLERVFYEIIDLVTSQIEERFCENAELLKAIDGIGLFDHESNEYFQTLGITIPSKEELAVVKDYMSRKGATNVFNELYNQREAFKNTYDMFATSVTFGCSTAVCESSFSTLTAINRPQRMAMEHQRMADLIFLAFERKQTEKLDFEVFLRKFNERGYRKLQLF